ncbi:hypothetical protein D3C81_1718900 [compost metagenome]
MDHIHQQRDHHRLLGEPVRADGSRQGIKQRLQEDPASDDIHIHFGMHEDIACYIQGSQQIAAEQQQYCTEDNAHRQIQGDGIAGHIGRFLRLPRAKILGDDDSRAIANYAEYQYSHGNDLIGRPDTGNCIV